MELPRLEDLDDEELLEADPSSEPEEGFYQYDDDGDDDEGVKQQATGGGLTSKANYGLTSSSQDIAEQGGSTPDTQYPPRSRSVLSTNSGHNATPFRGTNATSPYLPLPRQVSESPALLAERFTPSLPDATAASPSERLRTKDDNSDSGSDEDEDDHEEDDKLAAYFGYQRNDAMVPKAAYDAVVHRVRDLETSLGETNGQVRTYSHRISELEGSVEHYARQLKQKEAKLRSMDARERQLNLRERELLSREQAVEALAHQQRKMLRKKTSGNNNEKALPGGGLSTSFSETSESPLGPGVNDRVHRHRESGNTTHHSVVTPSHDTGRVARLPRIPGARPPSPDRLQGGNRSHSSMQ